MDHRILDTVVALVLFALMVVELAGKGIEPGASVSTLVAYVLAVALTFPVAVHRDCPMIALTVACAALVAYSAGRFSAFPGYAMFALLFAISLL